MEVVSVFDFAVVKTLFEGGGAGDEFPEAETECAGAATTAAVVEGIETEEAGAGGGAGALAGGFGAPILRVIVGGGAGASV